MLMIVVIRSRFIEDIWFNIVYAEECTKLQMQKKHTIYVQPYVTESHTYTLEDEEFILMVPSGFNKGTRLLVAASFIEAYEERRPTHV